jgi:hypothetical protein
LIANELRAYLSYRGSGLELTYYRSRSQIEVDFVVGDRIAIEVKASGRVGERDAKPLHALGEDAPIRTKIIVCSERSERRLDSGVLVMPVARFLEALWDDAIVTHAACGYPRNVLLGSMRLGGRYTTIARLGSDEEAAPVALPTIRIGVSDLFD